MSIMSVCFFFVVPAEPLNDLKCFEAWAEEDAKAEFAFVDGLQISVFFESKCQSAGLTRESRSPKFLQERSETPTGPAERPGSKEFSLPFHEHETFADSLHVFYCFHININPYYSYDLYHGALCVTLDPRDLKGGLRRKVGRKVQRPPDGG